MLEGGQIVAEWLRTARFRPGWILVSTESARLLADPDQLAVDLSSVENEGNGVYLVQSGTGERFHLIKHVGPLPAGINAEYTLDHTGTSGPPGSSGSSGEVGEVPVVVLTLSERLPEDEVAPVLARSLAESTAALRAVHQQPEVTETAQPLTTAAQPLALAADRVFGPAGTPDVDVVQRPSDHGLRAELLQRGRMADRASSRAPGRARNVHKKVRELALTMGVADEQPNAELRRTLLTADERAILDRAKNRTRPLEDRAAPLGYFGRSVGSSGASSLLMGTAAAAFTGDPLVGVGIAVPTIVNAAIGSITERRLDKQKIAGRRPAYDAERKVREHEHPGLPALLDSPPPDPPTAKKMPMATAWRNYVTRYTMPTLATAAVAGALTPLGVPAMSTALVIASSALAKSLAERLVDKKKLEFRLKRLDVTERVRLSDPDLYVSRLAAEFTDLQRRLDQLSGQHPAAGDTGAGDRPDLADVPGAPPYTVSLSSQLIENISGTARRAFVGGSAKPSANPSAVAEHLSPQVQSLLSAAGPGLLCAVTGAMGDQYFLNRDEIARDAAKLWLRGHQEAAQAAALAGVLEPRLRAFRDFTTQLENLTATKAAETRDLPVVTAPPIGPRPLARAGWRAYAVQAAAGSLGGVAGAAGLGLVVDIPDLALILTAAGATGTITATPAARFLFRRHELGVHEALETNKAFKAVNQSELRKQRAVARYLLAQLSLQAEAIVQQLGSAMGHYESVAGSNGFPELGAVAPADGRRVTGGITCQVRAGTALAIRRLAVEPGSKPQLLERLIALEKLDQAANASDHHAVHGTEESRAYVQEKFDEALAEAHQLWRDCGAPNGLALPALSDTPPEPVLDEDDKLRRMVNQLLHHRARPAETATGLAENSSTGHGADSTSGSRAADNASTRRTPNDGRNR
ncbi:hypothetical protein GCM10009804_17780 [Kribbella hippodromi]|uniref:Uncharacterized protein n=1 Tax=Kribbella hippodromi TaxID=434347 RepID=A0ABP4NGE7_9ACTN